MNRRRVTVFVGSPLLFKSSLSGMAATPIASIVPKLIVPKWEGLAALRFRPAGTQVRDAPPILVPARTDCEAPPGSDLQSPQASPPQEANLGRGCLSFWDEPPADLVSPDPAYETTESFEIRIPLAGCRVPHHAPVDINAPNRPELLIAQGAVHAISRCDG
jgi:hypothetical protein